MCHPAIMAALTYTGPAAATAGAALTSMGGMYGALSGAAITANASAGLATALSSSSFMASTLMNLASFANTAQQASAQGDAAAKTYLKEQMQLREAERQADIKHQVNLDMLARNAAMGMSTRRTTATAQGVAGEEDIMAFAIKENEIASFERANLKMEKSALEEASDQSFFKAKSAIDTARSATGPLAFMGLGAGIAGGYLDAYRMFGALPFEGQTSYSARILKGTA